MKAKVLARSGVAALLLLGMQSSMGSAAPASTDNPEPGLSGGDIPGGPPPGNTRGIMASLGGPSYAKPYVKGVRVVGHVARAGMQLVWVGDCAYSADGGTGINVIDVRDPAAPKYLRTLTDPGALGAGEAFDAVEAPNGRKLLIGGGRGAGPGGAKGGTTSLYDVSDCRNPRHIAELAWPDGMHTVHLGPSGMRVYGTEIDPASGHGGISAIDISDLGHPRYLGKFGATGPDGKSWEFGAHNITFSPDERRLYAGVIASRGGDLNRHIKTPEGQFSLERVNRDAGGVYIFDSSDFAAGRTDPKLRLIGTAQHAGWHDVTVARIGGVPHLVASGELGVCPGTWPRITNLADERNPRIVGEFRLDMNKPANCATPDAIPPGLAAAGVDAYAKAMSRASNHYSSIDSATNTRLGFFNMTGAGLRIADLRDPAHPVEIAYFRPGGGCSGFTRYFPATGRFWFTCSTGFYVAELAPEVRARLARR